MKRRTKKARARTKKARVAAKTALAKVAMPPEIPTLTGKAGDDLVVEVDVNDIVTPYTVIFDERTIIYGRTDRREVVSNLPSGTHRLTWSFSHVEKDWAHKVSARIGGGTLQQLEHKSEANKDHPYSIGWALVVIQ